jgi:hypothetical protein
LIDSTRSRPRSEDTGGGRRGRSAARPPTAVAPEEERREHTGGGRGGVAAGHLRRSRRAASGPEEKRGKVPSAGRAPRISAGSPPVAATHEAESVDSPDGRYDGGARRARRGGRVVRERKEPGGPRQLR